jgi:hypothetical protein
MTAIQIFLLMLGGHALADYPLQGDFLAKAKNHLAPLPGVPWYHALAAHSVIHGLFVGLITGSALLAVAEVFSHAAIDYLKSDGTVSFNVDQALHIGCKAIWCGLFFAMPDI